VLNGTPFEPLAAALCISAHPGFESVAANTLRFDQPLYGIREIFEGYAPSGHRLRIQQGTASDE
jgi:hypothetical protein